MDYAKYADYKGRGMVTIDTTGVNPVYTLSKYNTDTGVLEPTTSAEITQAVLDVRKAIINAQIAALQAELESISTLEKDIVKV